MSWLLPFPLPPLPSASSTGRHTGRLRMRDNLLTGEGGGVGGGAKSYKCEKAGPVKNVQYSLVAVYAAGIRHLFYI